MREIARWEQTGLRVDGQDVASQEPVLVEWDMTTGSGQSAEGIVTLAALLAC